MSPLDRFSVLLLFLASWPTVVQGSVYRSKKGTYRRPVVVYSDRIYCVYEDTRQEVPCMQHDNKKTALALIITGSILGAILLALAIYLFIRRHRYRHKSSDNVDSLDTEAEIKDEPNVVPEETLDQEPPTIRWHRRARNHVFAVSIVIALPFSIIALAIFSLTPRYDPFTIGQLSESAATGWIVMAATCSVLLRFTLVPDCVDKLIRKEKNRVLLCWCLIWICWFAGPLLGTTIMERNSISAPNRILPTWSYALSTMGASGVLAVFTATLGKWYAEGSGNEVT
ncbi:hypothetical protein DL96DRAFT_1623127 [Flagelloscypha sp. PMI_526]|nr:hypothetical protein DL96DRAFT_1623127 [Flagelloscypha sp. PMI_526]